MKVNVTLQDTANASHSVNLTEGGSAGTVVFNAGAESRQVNPDLFDKAVQNGLNVGSVPAKGFQVNTTVPESPAGKNLLVTNHPTDKNSVLITTDSISSTLNGNELRKAIRVARQT